MSQKQIQPQYRLSEDPKNYLELWKYFTDDATQIKDKMWTMATWLYTGLTGLLGFIVNNFINFDSDNWITKPELTAIACAAGILLGCYAMYMIYQYGRHIRSGWNRADYLRKRIEGFSEIWCLGNKEDIEKDISGDTNFTNLPPVARRLVVLAGAYTIVFVGMLVFV